MMEYLDRPRRIVIIVLVLLAITVWAWAGARAASGQAVCIDSTSCQSTAAQSALDIDAATRVVAGLPAPQAICTDLASCNGVIAARYSTLIQALKLLNAVAPVPAALSLGPIALVVGNGNPSAGAPYAVEAVVTIQGPIAVNFFVDGVLRRVEGSAKYCLYGGDAICGVGRLGSGTHFIRAQAMQAGTTNILADTSITVVEP